MARSRARSFLLPAMLVLLIAFGLRMWHLNTESIWHDEGWSIRAFRGPFTTPDDNTPYLYYLSGHLLWRLGGGETPLALRYISVLIGTLTVAVALRVGRGWFRPSAALTAGFLIAVSPLLWEYSQEVRAYVAVPLIALSMIASVDALLHVPRGEGVPRRLWMALFVVQLAGLYTHNLTVPLIVWMNALVGLMWLLGRQWRRVMIHAGWQIALIVAYAPWLSTQSPSGTPLNTPPQFSLALARDIWLSYFLPALPQVSDATTQGATFAILLTILGGLLAIWTVFVVLVRLRQGIDANIRLWLLVSHAVLVPILTTLLMIVAGIDFHPRYYIASVPGTLFLVVYLAYTANLTPPERFVLRTNILLSLSIWRGDSERRLRSKQGANRGEVFLHHIALALLFTIISISSLHSITTTRAYQHDDFAGLAAYYATLPEGHVILIPFDAERALQDYFDHVMDIPPRFVNVTLYSDEAAAVETINALYDDGVRHVEFLTWFQLPADARGMYSCLLAGGHDGDTLPEPQFFFGLSTQSYALSPLDLNEIPLGSNYRQIELVDTAYVAGKVAACVRTSWRLNATTDEKINIAATIQTPLQTDLARSDAELARDDNAGTSDWSAGEVGSAYNLLLLPPGIPRDDYTLTLNVYTASQPNGFDLLDAAGNPVGKTLILQDALSLQSTSLRDVNRPTLLNDSSENNMIQTGIPIDITLALPAGTHTVALAGLMQTVTHDIAAQSWHRFILPPGSDDTAILTVNDGEIARYTVVDVPRTFDQPDFDIPLDVSFGDVGRLVGATIHPPISPDMLPQITLVWQAEGGIDTAYTVFVQMIGTDGTVIAQSDRQPADGTRPTTSWVDGEYIVDRHTLRRNVPDYIGEMRIITGLYNANDGFRRVLTEDGADFVEIETIHLPN